MGVLDWLGKHWFEAIQSVGIIAGLALNALALRQGAKVRRISNPIAITATSRIVSQRGQRWRGCSTRRRTWSGRLSVRKKNCSHTRSFSTSTASIAPSGSACIRRRKVCEETSLRSSRCRFQEPFGKNSSRSKTGRSSDLWKPVLMIPGRPSLSLGGDRIRRTKVARPRLRARKLVRVPMPRHPPASRVRAVRTSAHSPRGVVWLPLRPTAYARRAYAYTRLCN